MRIAISGSPIEIVVRIEAQSSAAIGKELFSVKLAYTRQSVETVETVEISFAPSIDGREAVEALESSPDVLSSLQMLLNARARREAMERIDIGDREGALGQIAFCLADMGAAQPSVRNTDTFREELNDLQALFSSIESSEDDAMARKQMAYRRESLRKGR